MTIKLLTYPLVAVLCLLTASVAFSTETTQTTTTEVAVGVDAVNQAVPTEPNIDQSTLKPATPEDKANGLKTWSSIYQVLSHPRCVNCHVADDRPRWSGKSYGKTSFHGMNVQAGPTRMGKPGQQMCLTCHTKTNSEVPHGPPGAEIWALAPAAMAWWGKSSRELCETVKDPAKTGGRDIPAFAEHIGHDKLVAWAWNPGPGREVAPFSAEETVAMLQTWLSLGLPCPE